MSAPLLQPAALSRLLAWALLDVLLIVACWGLCALGPGWLFWLVAPVIGSRVHALAVLLHEVCHGPPTVGVSARLIEVLGGWTVGTTLEAMRAHHLRHHARTNGASDPYFIPRKRFGQAGLFVVLLGLVPFWVFRSLVGSASLLVPALRTPYAWLLVFGEDDEASQREVDRARTREPLVVLFWLGLAAATAFWPSWWLRQWWLPLGWLALFNAVRFVAEHSTLEVEARTDPRATHDHTGQLVGFFVFPHHIGHHRAHHLFPSASWEALPALTRTLVQPDLATADGPVPR
jgi:fatty acid desaturase